MDRNDWLKAVKAGDKVAIEHGYGGSYTVRTVSHITPKHGHIVLDDGSKFDSKYFGNEIGSGGYNRRQIVAYDQKVIDSIKRNNRKYYLSAALDQVNEFLRGKDQPVEQLDKLLEALKSCGFEYKKKEE